MRGSFVLRGLLQRLGGQVFGRRQLVDVGKDAQRMAGGGQIVETLIFQCEFEENVARRQPDQQGKEAGRGSEKASSNQGRHQGEPAHSYSEHDQERAHPLNQEVLNPRITQLVIQQHVNRFGNRDQITERAVLVSEDEHFVRHK
jgi:hypothetical protein